MKYNLVGCFDPILKQPVENFDFNNPPIIPIDLACNLAETMLYYNGYGLSANQCGLPYRVFVLHGGEEIITCFNPRIVDVSNEDILLEEGCLSFPELIVKVKRARRIKVRYADPNGEIETRTFDGITARCFQHELDHLDGVTFLQRASKIHKDKAMKVLKRLNRSNKKQGALPPTN